MPSNAVALMRSISWRCSRAFAIGKRNVFRASVGERVVVQRIQREREKERVERERKREWEIREAKEKWGKRC